MNRHIAPRRFNKYAPEGGARKQKDYCGPSLNNARLPDFEVERSVWSNNGGGCGSGANEGDKYSGYPSNGEFRSSRGSGSDSNIDMMRFDSPNPKESGGSSSSSFYFHEPKQDELVPCRSSSLPKTGEVCPPERWPQSDNIGTVRNENCNKSRAVYQQQQQGQQLPLLHQQWQSNVNSFPSKCNLRYDNHLISAVQQHLHLPSDLSSLI